MISAWKPPGKIWENMKIQQFNSALKVAVFLDPDWHSNRPASSLLGEDIEDMWIMINFPNGHEAFPMRLFKLAT